MKAGAQTLGLATGSSPITFYEEIVKSNLDFSNMVSINLDEYVGIAASNDQSYSYFMHKHLLMLNLSRKITFQTAWLKI